MTIKPFPERWLVIQGNVVDGFEFFGPFADHDRAHEWAEQLDDDYAITKLLRP